MIYLKTRKTHSMFGPIHYGDRFRKKKKKLSDDLKWMWDEETKNEQDFSRSVRPFQDIQSTF